MISRRNSSHPGNARRTCAYTNMTGELPVTSFMAEAVHQTLVLADNLGFGDRFVRASSMR